MTSPVPVDVLVGSPEWLEYRRGGVGASEIPIILGLSPWGSAYELFHSKVTGIDTDLDNDAMSWGRALEGAILDRFDHNHPELNVDTGGLYHHHEREWQLATPDGIAYTECGCDIALPFHCPHESDPPVAVVQAKVAARWDHWGDEGTDDVPVHYRAQVLWEMDVMGVDVAHIPVLVPPFGYREFVVHYDPDDAAILRRAGREFVDRMRRNDPPDVDDRAATTRTLRALHPDRGEGGTEIPATLHRQWRLADRLEKAAASRRVLAENRIRHAMGDAQHVTVDGQPVGNRTVYNQRRVDSKALRAAGLFDRYATTTTVNRLSMKRDKEPNHAG